MKKGEILFWMFMIGMYAFAFTLSPLMNYTSYLRSAAAGHVPDPANVELANKIDLGYFATAGIYFGFTAIFWVFSYFSTWKLANRYPRLNIKLVFEPRYARLHLGMGIISVREIKGSSMEVMDGLRSGGLQKAFDEIKVEVEKKFHGKRAAESTNPDDKQKQATSKNKRKDDKTINFTIDDLKKEDLNFESFPIELLHKIDWDNFFETSEIDFFKSLGIKDTQDFLKQTYAELDIVKSKYYNKFNKQYDIAKIQIMMKKCLEFLNKEQVEFLKIMNIHNFQDLLDADLEKINAKYNDQFIMPKTKFTDKFINIMKVLTGGSDLTKRIDFKIVVKMMVEELIAREKNFAIEIDKLDYMKYVNIKITRVKSIFPDKHAYLIDFDQPFQIPASLPEFDFYKAREKDQITRDRNDREIDIDKYDSVPIKSALVLAPISLNDCFVYHPGELDDFNGHQVDCNMMTDVVCRFRGMLTADICVIEIRACDWSVNYSAVNTIDWTDEEVYNIDMAAMWQLLRDQMLIMEDLKKALETEQARTEKKDKELDKMWAKKWADITPDQAVKRLLTAQPKPLNVFTVIVIIAIAIIFCVLGLVMGIFLYPWLGQYFGLPGVLPNNLVYSLKILAPVLGSMP